jgi:hypothetical protein
MTISKNDIKIPKWQKWCQKNGRMSFRWNFKGSEGKIKR